MSGRDPAAALQRALDLSHQLVRIAEDGDADLAVSLDAERLELLKFVRHALRPMEEHHRAVLREISALNYRSIGSMEHRFRAKCRDMDMLAVGRRALRAYTGA
jgi:hypothetical protein